MRAAKLIALVAALGVAVVAGATVASGAASSKAKTVVVTDPADASQSPVDITRVSLGRASKDRVKFSVRGAADFDAGDLLASKGPPGSICARLWTKSTPPDQSPDYLVCITATKDADYRASVLRERANRLPRRVGKATVENDGDRSVTITFRQASIGAPKELQFSAESTRAGCVKLSCIDTAPNAPATAEVVLRSGSSSGNSTK